MEYGYYGFCLTESEEHFLHTIGLGDVPRRHSFTTRNHISSRDQQLSFRNRHSYCKQLAPYSSDPEGDSVTAIFVVR